LTLFVKAIESGSELFVDGLITEFYCTSVGPLPNPPAEAVIIFGNI
jgi:hypothetical protein